MAQGVNNTVGSFQKELTEAEPKEYQVQPPTELPSAPQGQVSSCIVRALKGNAGIIYVGAKGVTAATGFELAAGDAVNLDLQSLGNLWAIGTKAKDKLCVLWIGG